jgi:hypothetical protein
VLVEDREGGHQAVDFDHLALEHAVAEVLDLQDGAQDRAQQDVEGRQAVLLAPGPVVGQVGREAEVDRGTVHAVEELEAVAPLFEIVHANRG